MSKSVQMLKRKMHGLMFRFPGMITCNELEDFILAYLENELSPRQKRVFELHLRVCRSCRLYLATYKRTLAATKVSQKDLDDLETSVPEDLVAAILAAKKE